jgi:hypothetical protein
LPDRFGTLDGVSLGMITAALRPRATDGGRATALAGVTLLVLAGYGCDRDASRQWDALRMAGDTTAFDPAMVAQLPEPARRFLTWAIAPGTPLPGSVELDMHGEIRLAPDGELMAMTARQILAPPVGFIWRARVDRGLVRIRGYDRYVDGQGEMRWRLYGLVPVVRATGEDVTRSAAGRLAMEAVLQPAALLPGRGARWEPVNENAARFTLTVNDETVTTLLVVDPEGRPVRASAMRWRPESPDGPAYVRFDVEMSGEARVGGITLPRRLRAGWRLGEADEFRFFQATLDQATFR